MRKFLKHSILWILLLAFLGCFAARETVRPRFYIPTLAPTKVTEPWPSTLAVQLLEVAPHLQGDRIAAHTSAVEIEYYSDYRWAGSLDRLLTQEIQNFLRPVFAKVESYNLAASCHYVLRGQITAFEEVDRDNQWFGKVGLELYLEDVYKKEIIWSEYMEIMEPAQARNPQAVVFALRAGLERLLSQALEQWKKVL